MCYAQVSVIPHMFWGWGCKLITRLLITKCSSLPCAKVVERSIVNIWENNNHIVSQHTLTQLFVEN